MSSTFSLLRFLTIAASALLPLTIASAQTSLTWDVNSTAGVTGGTGAWNTSVTNWTIDAGATNIAWENLAEAPMRDAIFSGAAGTVTVGEAISIRNMTFSNTSGTYSITGGTLNFTAGTIFMSSANGNSSTASVTIASNISGAPTINTTVTGSSARRYDFTVPANGNIVLGNLVSANHNSADHVSTINLGGGANSTGELGRSLSSNSGQGNRLYFNSGNWTLKGAAYSRDQLINGATVTIAIGGQLRSSSREVLLQAGTLNYNNPSAVRHDSTTFDGSRNFRITGGTMNQTSGLPITTSTHNPDMVWGGNWTFSGTNGVNSNLFLGNGRVSLGGGQRTVTVTNAETTLSVGGAISNSHIGGSGTGTLTKAGAGTLELRGNNTYTGATNVNAGTLAIPSGTYASSFNIGSTATLQLNLDSTITTTGGMAFVPGSKVRLVGTPTLPSYTLFTSVGSMTGSPSIETPVAEYELFVEGRSLKFAKNTDTDADGLPDWWELQFSSAVPADNTSLDPAMDMDSDGATNLQEFLRGTNANNPDTDSDGLLDGVETNTGSWVSAINAGTDPLTADTDGDSLLDGVETNTGIWGGIGNRGTNPHIRDSDGDSYPDNAENNSGTYVSASNTGTNPNKADTDDDGAGDWYEIAATFTDPSNTSSKPVVPYPLPDPDSSTGNPNKPVKVYIMSGQSNMVGFGTVNGSDSSSLSYITRTLNRFPNLIDSAGNFLPRQDVRYRGVISAIGNGPLAPGFSANAATFGPEVGFGQIMGWFHDEGVLLIKSSIGNRALGWDILPHGTPSWVYNGNTYPGYGLPTPTTQGAWYAGKEFDRFFKHESEWAHPDTAAINVVDILDGWIAEYGGSGKPFAGRDFQIAGFVWWQGERDRGDMGHASVYERNLVNLINSLRTYYSNRYPGKVVPNAPFVLATLGEASLAMTTPATDVAIRNAHFAVDSATGSNPQTNVKTVYSHPLSEGGDSNAHYGNRAGTYIMVGDALGRAMVSLQSSTTENTFASWMAGFSSVPSNLAGFNQDADGDGVENGVENFFGTNPSIGSAGLVSGTTSGNTFTFTHPQNATSASGISASYRWSKDLTTFHANGESDGVTTVNFNTVTTAGITTVTATVTGTATSKLFVDVKVIQN